MWDFLQTSQERQKLHPTSLDEAAQSGSVPAVTRTWDDILGFSSHYCFQNSAYPSFIPTIL